MKTITEWMKKAMVHVSTELEDQLHNGIFKNLPYEDGMYLCQLINVLQDPSALVGNGKMPDKTIEVPKEPTEAMWGGLARDLILVWEEKPPTASNTLKSLQHMTDVPQWLIDDLEKLVGYGPMTKADRAVLIYKAMIHDWDLSQRS